MRLQTGASHRREEQTHIERLEGHEGCPTFRYLQISGSLVCNFELGSADSSPGPLAAAGLQGGHAWLEERAQSAVGLPEGSRYSMNCVPPFSELAQGWETFLKLIFTHLLSRFILNEL